METKPFYSLGCGDRFCREGEAQLAAYIEAARKGVVVHPVWNKSHREHTTSRPNLHRFVSKPTLLARQVDGSILILDADHINLTNVNAFIDSSDFFTLDVADFIGRMADQDSIDCFVEAMQAFCGN